MQVYGTRVELAEERRQGRVGGSLESIPLLRRFCIRKKKKGSKICSYVREYPETELIFWQGVKLVCAGLAVRSFVETGKHDVRSSHITS